MQIRNAVEQDMPNVLKLIKELATFEKQPDAVVITADDLARDGFSKNPLFYTFVAEVDNKIIGIAIYYYRYSTWKGKTLHLEDLIVQQPYRGIGAGYALYAEIIKQGKKEGVRRIEWAVLNWNEPAIAFYKKLGASHFTEWDVVQMDENAINAFIDKNLQ
ncbi:MAG: GNAT family N-acetyltransferase [Flavobacterium sp.]|nr:GNAT family N-acetyltransferase [Flavobacterium sp.]